MQTSVYRSRVAMWLAIGISMCWTLARSFGLGAFPAADTASFSLCLAASLSSVARRLSPRSPSPSAAKLSTSTHSAAASTAPTVAKRLPAAIVFRFQLIRASPSTFSRFPPRKSENSQPLPEARKDGDGWSRACRLCSWSMLPAAVSRSPTSGGACVLVSGIAAQHGARCACARCSRALGGSEW